MKLFFLTNHIAVFLFLTKADVSTPHRDLKGVVVTLSNEGHLQCSYMGTDPSFFSTPKVDDTAERHQTDHQDPGW